MTLSWCYCVGSRINRNICGMSKVNGWLTLLDNCICQKENKVSWLFFLLSNKNKPLRQLFSHWHAINCQYCWSYTVINMQSVIYVGLFCILCLCPQLPAIFIQVKHALMCLFCCFCLNSVILNDEKQFIKIIRYTNVAEICPKSNLLCLNININANMTVTEICIS